MFKGNTLRLGLCCIFREENIQFKSRQAGYIGKHPREEQLDRLTTTILHNASSLLRSLEYCWEHDIGCFRVNSRILPLKSHPQLNYSLADLPEVGLVMEIFAACKKFSHDRNIRMTFHPDQFTLLSSPHEYVTRQSLKELEYHAEIAELLNADVIALHGGGAYGDKKSALKRLEQTILQLPDDVRSRLALENDDRIYSPSDLLPVCERTGVPFIYDVHHHRCLPDSLTVEEATEKAFASWNREPLFHISSPRDGWQTKNTRPHHDYIDAGDIPDCWSDLEYTLEVEAKAKELAIARLQNDLKRLKLPVKQLNEVRMRTTHNHKHLG